MAKVGVVEDEVIYGEGVGTGTWDRGSSSVKYEGDDLQVRCYYIGCNLNEYAISSAQVYSNTPVNFDYKLERPMLNVGAIFVAVKFLTVKLPSETNSSNGDHTFSKQPPLPSPLRFSNSSRFHTYIHQLLRLGSIFEVS
ncbi:unnamed protein product [Lupinus luteus]|uniref:Uncharacterized protein n=1 Tax=Lupinus luteus TaxID=3873 RepID=A0AAV1XCF2_LUPLU